MQIKIEIQQPGAHGSIYFYIYIYRKGINDELNI